MEGFKQNPKMKSDIACYKEGGSVYKAKEHKGDSEELKEDKAMVKKGIRQHETAKHKGEEKTEIKLKHGGRSKKEGGNVRKYKTGGVCNPMKEGGKTGEVNNAMKSGGLSNPMKKGGHSKKPVAGTAKKAVTRKADGGVISDYDSTITSRAPMAQPITRPRTLPDNLQQMKGGMGQAASVGPMGNAAPLGVVSDQERQILRGLQALGQYAEGGGVK